MAGNSDVMKEYLLALGFRLDEKSTKTFDTTTTKFDKRVKQLAISTFSLGVAAQAMVLQFGRAMEQLYYKSRLAESTATNLQAIGYAGSQIGLGVDGMQNAVMRMASAIRQNPGLIGLLNDLRIPVQGRDMSDVFKDLVKATKSMPFYIGNQYASLFGISPDELLLLQEGSDKLEALEAQQKRMSESMGLNMEAAVLAGKEYAELMRELQQQGTILAQVVAVNMLPAFKELAGVTKEVLNDWARLVPKIANNPGGYWDRLLEGMGLKRPGGGVVMTPDAERRSKILALGRGPLASLPDVNSNSPIGLRNNNPGNLRRWGDAPTVGGFAAFDTPQEGLSAMAANLLAYQRRGLTSLNKIIATWAPSSENNTKAYVDAVSKSTGFKSDALLNLSDPSTLQSLMAAMIKHENGFNPFSSTDLSGAVQSRLGTGVSMQQNTYINVYGSNAGITAEMVKAKQDKVNGDLARNLGNMVVK